MSCPQIKICGLTNVEQAVECGKLGADAIGLVFYEKSPRNVSTRLAARIAEHINGLAVPVAVTVDMEIDDILELAISTGIATFQLHGKEPPQYAERLSEAGLRVIKHIKAQSGDELAAMAAKFCCKAFLAECGEGVLPGGNRSKWDWAQARALAGTRPFVLAGGLDCENVESAIMAATPDAVDVSSALESSAGIKDMKLVEKFIEQTRQTSLDRNITRIF